MLAWLKRTFPILFEKEMPIWFTIIASCLAATGAYYISPAVNRQFQIDETRSAHLARTTEGLNADIILLSTKVRRLNEALVNDSGNIQELRGECLDVVTRLQWKLVDLRVVLRGGDDRAAVDRLARAIAGVKDVLDVAVDKRAEPRLLEAMRDLASETRDVLDRLYAKASLK